MAARIVRMRLRILGADIDEALGRTNGETRNRHALDEHERIALENHAVRERARIAFVGVADDVFLVGLSAEHGLPLDAGRECRAAAAAQAGVGDGRDDLLAA